MKANETERKIKAWLKRYGPKCNDPDFGYDDCQMVDDCIYDLDLTNDDRPTVRRLVDAYIQEH